MLQIEGPFPEELAGFFFVLFAASVACGSSWTRNGTHTTAGAQAIAVTTPDP